MTRDSESFIVPPEDALQRGGALLAADRPDEAVECFQQVLSQDPSKAEAWCNLASAFRAQARLDDAIECCRRGSTHQPSCVQLYDNLVFTANYSPKYTPADIFEEVRRWNDQYAAPLSRFIQPHSNDRLPHRRLKIGYVSPDFRTHVLSVFLLPLLAGHDRRNFEIFCYSNVASPDFATLKFQQLAHVWRNIRDLPDEQVADRIRADQIDILVDLTMHSGDNRLLVFARKPAPIQMTWLAYPGTTGLTAIDYRLTDPYLDPPGQFDAFYAEASIRLPDTFWCYTPIAQTPVSPLPARQNGCLTLGSLNTFCKINTDTLRLWASVLKAIDRSKLLLLAPEGSSRRWVMSTLAQEGIASHRIEFIGRQVRGAYLETYHRIDIGLDTLPYNGHTTSLDALWMGVPIVSLVGHTVVGRAGLSQLTNLGLSDLIAHTPAEYVRIAAQLASDMQRLSELRATLRPRMEQSPLMDAARFARGLQTVYRAIWHQWLKNGCPADPDAAPPS
jgi:protein O-GlcNAc transferase